MYTSAILHGYYITEAVTKVLRVSQKIKKCKRVYDFSYTFWYMVFILRLPFLLLWQERHFSYTEQC